jgi:hypothetical protein
MSRPYKITAFDKNVADLAARFSIANPSVIYELNQEVFEAFPDGGDPRVAFAPSHVGLVIQVPDDANKDLYEWETYTAKKGETLAAICAKKNKDRRIDPSRKGVGMSTPPWLEPQYLLDLYENQNVRAGYGPDAPKVHLAQGELVAIPFPKSRMRTRPISATPNGKTKVEVHPAWIDEIDNWVKSLQIRTRKFEASMMALRKQKEKGLREVQILQAARAVLTLEIECPAGGPSQVQRDIAGMKRFAPVLDDLIDVALTEMFVNNAKNVEPDLLRDTTTLGEGIVKDLKGDDLKRLVKALVKVADRYPRTTNEISWALCYAYQTIADSFLCEKIGPDIEAAARYLAGLKKIKVDGLRSEDPKFAQAIQALSSGTPMDPLATLISLLQVAGSSVGNLPGPSTLAVAVVRLKAVYNGYKRVLAQRNSVAIVTITIEDQVILTGAAVNALTSNEADATDLLIVASRVRTSRTITALHPESFKKGYMKAALGAADDAANKGIMSSPSWIRGMTFLNVLVAGLVAYDILSGDGTTHTWLELAPVGLGIGGAIPGVLKVISSHAAVNAIAEGAARTVALVGVFYSAYQTSKSFEKGDTVGGVLNAISTVGSFLLFVSVWTGPFAGGFAAVGGAMVVIASVALIVRDLLHSSTSRWWEAVAEEFEKGTIYGKVKAKAPLLAAKVQAFKSAMANTTFLLVDPEYRETLNKYVDDDHLPMLLANSNEPMEVPMGI